MPKGEIVDQFRAFEILNEVDLQKCGICLDEHDECQKGKNDAFDLWNWRRKSNFDRGRNNRSPKGNMWSAIPVALL